MSHWSFVLMGLHLGMHIPAMTAGMKLKNRTKTILTVFFICIGGIGLWLFLRNGMQDYLFFRVPFAFLDYEKAGWLVVLENLLMLSFWAFIGTRAATIFRTAAQKAKTKKNPLISVIAIIAAVVIGVVLMFLFPSADSQMNVGNADWSVPQAETAQKEETAGTQEASQMESVSVKPDNEAADYSVSVDDSFLFIQGGSFLMGSPETENWRIYARRGCNSMA